MADVFVVPVLAVIAIHLIRNWWTGRNDLL